MLKYVLSQFIVGPELRKVQEQYKEFFIFLNRYGYQLISKYNRRIHRNRTAYNIHEHRIIENYDTIDYRCIELIFGRPADFVSISKLFQEQTNMVLPLYPDLIANQFLGIRFLRKNDKYNLYYEVDQMGFEILNSEYTTHYRMFEMTRNYVHPWFSEPFESYDGSQEFLDKQHLKAIKECVNGLVLSIEYYNTNNRGDGWYISYMKTNHPDAIPILIKYDSQ